MRSQAQNLLPKFKNLPTHELSMLSGLMLQSTMDLFEVSMFNLALLSIQGEFGLSIEVLSLVVAVRYLARIGLMPIYGLIGDRIGKKKTFAIGLVIFILGTAACFLSPSLLWLVIGRLLMGVGGGILPLSMAIITDHFPIERRGRVLGLWNAAAPAGSLLGLLLGGFLIETFGWRSIFIAVGLGSTVALGLVIRLVPSSAKNHDPETHVDWFGATCLFSTVTGLLLATTTSSVFPFGSTINLAFWAVFGLALSLLVWNTIRNPNALISLDIIKNRHLIIPSIAVIFRMFALTGASFIMVLYLANVFDKSPTAAGVLILFHSVPLFVGIPLGGILADRWSSRRVAGLAMIIQASGMVWLGLVNPDLGALLLIPGMIIGGLGAAFSLTPFSKGAISSLDEQQSGLAAGLYNMIRFTGAAASTPLLGLILAAGFEKTGGTQSAPQPYQYSFLILAACALIGAVIASFIPLPSPSEERN